MIDARDIAEIQNMLNLYPHIVDDEAQYARAGELFTEDAIYDASIFGLGRHHGLSEIESYWRHSDARKKDPNHPFAHNVVNIHVFEDTDGKIRAISRCLATYRDGRSAVAVYHDVMKRTKDGWRIADRRMAPMTGSGGR